MNSYLVATISIAAFFVGQLLVTRRHWTGFLIWAMSNYLVAATCVIQANQATACMFLVYFGANVCSMVSWRRHAPQPKASWEAARS